MGAWVAGFKTRASDTLRLTWRVVNMPLPAGPLNNMLNPVAVYRPDGTLRRRVSPKALSVRYWQRFTDDEKTMRRGPFGKMTSDMHKQLKSFMAFEKVCDSLTYDHGV